MFDRIVTLIGSAATGQEATIEALISNAEAFIMMFCNLSEYSSRFDSILVRMVIEDFNRLGSEGLKSKTFSGLSETYTDDPYSSVVMTFLRKNCRIKTL